MTYLVRKFRFSEYHILKEWVTLQKWNPGLYDHLAQQHLNGFWMGTIDEQPVACFGAIQYDQTYTHLAWYIVKPEFRFRGYGIQLWDKALGSLTSKTIGLYAVKGKQQTYAKQGFNSFGRTGVYYALSKGVQYKSDNLIDCKSIDNQQLSRFDKKNFPSERKQFLKKWINFPQTHSVAFLKDNQILGYGVVRPAVDGFKIGPLYANQLQIAQQIYRNLVGVVPAGFKAFIDIPDANLNGIRLVEEEKMTLTSSLTRMYSNGEPEPRIGSKVYHMACIFQHFLFGLSQETFKYFLYFAKIIEIFQSFMKIRMNFPQYSIPNEWIDCICFWMSPLFQKKNKKISFFELFSLNSKNDNFQPLTFFQKIQLSIKRSQLKFYYMKFKEEKFKPSRQTLTGHKINQTSFKTFGVRIRTQITLTLDFLNSN